MSRCSTRTSSTCGPWGARTRLCTAWPPSYITCSSHRTYDCRHESRERHLNSRKESQSFSTRAQTITLSSIETSISSTQGQTKHIGTPDVGIPLFSPPNPPSSLLLFTVSLDCRCGVVSRWGIGSWQDYPPVRPSTLPSSARYTIDLYKIHQHDHSS